MRPTVRSAFTAAPVEGDGGFGVFGAGLGANAARSGANRFDGDAAALEYRDETQTIGAVDDDFEPRMSGADAPREMCDRAHVRHAPRRFATVAARPPLVGQHGSEIDRGGRQNATPFSSAAIGRNHRTQPIRPGKLVS